MKVKTRKIFAVLLALVMLLCAMPIFGAIAVDEADPNIVSSGICGKKLIWTLDVNGIFSVTGTGKMKITTKQLPWETYLDQIKEVDIADGVTSIIPEAFSGCRNLTDVSIGDTVKTISKAAFKNCVKLEQAVLPASLETLGDSAFENCSSLENILIPAGVKKINNYAFTGCEKLETVTFANDITYVGDYAFYLCRSLKAFDIPEGVKYIGSHAFFGCRCITDINIPGSVKMIGDHAFYHCDSLMNLVIEEGPEEEPATEETSAAVPTVTPEETTTEPAGEETSEEAEAETPEVVVDNLRRIKAGAFTFCNALTSVTLPADIDELSGYPFLNCPSLKTVTVKGGELDLYDSGFGMSSIKLNGAANDIAQLASAYANGNITLSAYEKAKDDMVENLEVIENINGFVVYGLRNAPTEQYAKGNNFIFVPLGSDSHEHNFVESSVVAPTCTQTGTQIFACTGCEETYSVPLAKAAHPDDDGDGFCNVCGKKIGEPTKQPENDDEEEQTGFFAKIKAFFQKILKTISKLFKKKK